MANILKGDCLERMAELPADSVDSIVTDPPYGLSFLGNKWDHNVPSVDIWRECLRVLKPGGHLLAFAGTRTQHRMVVNIEDAGFEIRDMIAWVYGSGFPKGMDVSKAIDKAAGAKREVCGHYESPEGTTGWRGQNKTGAVDFGASRYEDGERRPVTAPATDAAKQWEGWGTALKPAIEPITVARKPFKGTVAANVLEHGTGALNIDGCRVGTDEKMSYSSSKKEGVMTAWDTGTTEQHRAGRFPANLIHDGSEEVVGLFPHTQSGELMGYDIPGSTTEHLSGLRKKERTVSTKSSGSAARFFYCAKARKRDRDEGLEHKNPHPTVKPTKLMRYLVRLVTPPGGTVLDPFMGSGSTGKAAALEGFPFIGIEISPEYIEIARARIEHAEAEAGEER